VGRLEIKKDESNCVHTALRPHLAPQYLSSRHGGKPKLVGGHCCDMHLTLQVQFSYLPDPLAQLTLHQNETKLHALPRFQGLLLCLYITVDPL
jgi:hypothetical protein